MEDEIKERIATHSIEEGLRLIRFVRIYLTDRAWFRACYGVLKGSDSAGVGVG